MSLPQSGYLTTWHTQRDARGWGDYYGRLTNDFFVIRSIPFPSYILYGWLNVRGGVDITGAVMSNVIGYYDIYEARQHAKGPYYILIEVNSVKGHLIIGEFLCRTFAKW